MIMSVGIYILSKLNRGSIRPEQLKGLRSFARIPIATADYMACST
jgi:hypothetical protein